MDGMRVSDDRPICHLHCSHLKVLHDTSRSLFYYATMIDPDSNPTRTLTLVLPEDDWKALRAAEPDAIGWLRAQIQNRLAEGDGGGTQSESSAPWSSRSNPASASTAETWWGNEDEY
jgi:hypothetical protein